MTDEQKRRERAAEIRREVQKRRAARAAGSYGKKIAEDFFDQAKVKMVMRIYGVSCERAKEIIAGRVAKKTVHESKNRAEAERDGDWIPMDKIIGMEVGEIVEGAKG